MSQYQNEYLADFLLALFLTLSIEVPLLVLYLKVSKGYSLPLSKVIPAGLLCSIATLPYLWFVAPHYLPAEWYFYGGEAMVTLAEALILYSVLSLKASDALLASLFCNTVSAAAGPYLFSLLGFGS